MHCRGPPRGGRTRPGCAGRKGTGRQRADANPCSPSVKQVQTPASLLNLKSPLQSAPRKSWALREVALASVLFQVTWVLNFYVFHVHVK